MPIGTIAEGPSLILNACRECNQEKGKLEDDISAITLLSDLADKNPSNPHADTIRRKAIGSLSRETGKRVSESYVRDSIKGTLFPGVEVSFGFVAPPLISPERIQKLAAFHLQAFYYWLTYDTSTRMGQYIAHPITFFPDSARRDWGNVVSRHFAKLTYAWPKWFFGCFAEGYFRVVVRKAPTAANVHSFALEWNKSLRVIGFVGEREDVQEYETGFPEHAWKYRGPNERYRREIPIDEADDVLFA